VHAPVSDQSTCIDCTCVTCDWSYLSHGSVIGLYVQGFANYTYDLIVALNSTQADLQVNGTRIIQQVRRCNLLQVSIRCHTY